ncbi:MAG: flagellar basal body rod protein FlgC [Alphaproteobacteria bacterium]|nr:MAG: flagellar basal body rod protein FlgC [Alphaproteobacteria bacterium]
MSGDIANALMASANGMRVQGARIRVISENIANADTTGLTPGSDPYERQTISFKNHLDREMGVSLVEVNKISVDSNTPFTLQYNPDHPAANTDGYVKMPNVNTMLEMMDAKEAQRSYEANLGMIEQSRAMISRTIDLLRN